MKAATVHEIKEELSHLSQKQLLVLCNKLARFKKENKELLTYLLFEAQDEHAYKEGIKKEVQELFKQIPRGNSPYLIRKSLRKILRLINKYSRYSANKETEIELLIYYCRLIGDFSIPIDKSTALTSLFANQIKKIKKLLPSLHEDLQFDYSKEVEEISRRSM